MLTAVAAVVVVPVLSELLDQPSAVLLAASLSHADMSHWLLPCSAAGQKATGKDSNQSTAVSHICGCHMHDQQRCNLLRALLCQQMYTKMFPVASCTHLAVHMTVITHATNSTGASIGFFVGMYNTDNKAAQGKYHAYASSLWSVHMQHFAQPFIAQQLISSTIITMPTSANIHASTPRVPASEPAAPPP